MANVYLGRRVPDTGRKGLDNLNELRGIIRAIIDDVRRGRISPQLGMRRMVLLYLVSKKVFLTKYRSPLLYAQARRMIDAGVQILQRMRSRRR